MHSISRIALPGLASVAGPLLLLSLSQAVHAADIGVVGLFRDKAVLVVDGAAPKTYSVGTALLRPIVSGSIPSRWVILN